VDRPTAVRRGTIVKKMVLLVCALLFVGMLLSSVPVLADTREYSGTYQAVTRVAMKAKAGDVSFSAPLDCALSFAVGEDGKVTGGFDQNGTAQGDNGQVQLRYKFSCSGTVAADGTLDASGPLQLTGTDPAMSVTLGPSTARLSGTIAGSVFTGTFEIPAMSYGVADLAQYYVSAETLQVKATREGGGAYEEPTQVETTETRPTQVETTEKYGEASEGGGGTSWEEETEETEATSPPTTKPKYRDSGCRFSDLSGAVAILLPGAEEDDWQTAKLNDPLPFGTLIRTGIESYIILSFDDGTTFVMKPETIVRLSEPEETPSRLGLLWGNIKANAQSMLKNGSMKVEMGQAAASIKGTIFTLEDDGSVSRLKVIEGSVDFESKATGESIQVGAGQTVSADKSGLGEVTSFDVASEQAKWDDLERLLAGDDGAGGLPIWAYILIGVGAAIVLGGVALLLLMRRGRRARHCPRCGQPATQGTQFCGRCGAPMAPVTNPTGLVVGSVMAALILLAGLGVGLYFA
jgi:hypothetical protein